MTSGSPFNSTYRGVPPGTQLNGIYVIDGLIAAGGMGEIYKGREIQTGVTIAIKMLLPDMAGNEAALELFRREASALHHLPHDAIVRYFLFTVEPVLQRPYLAMEFVDGRSLSDLLDAGALPFESVVALMRRLASALHVAHGRGIVHRDVSPDNVIVPLDDVTRAKIIDFGIARLTQVGDPTIIGSGFAGKHNYVSPEQVGLFGHNVTFKSDIYSLGLVLFHAATGTKLDMGGSQFQLVEKRRRVPDLSMVDARLRPILDRMLQPDPADRPASMAEIAEWGLPERTSANFHRPEAIARTAGGGLRSRSARAAMFAVAGLVLVGAASAGYYYFGMRRGPAELAKRTEPPKLTPTTTTPSTAPSAAPTAIRVDRVRAYIDQYNGGDCFLAVPVAVNPNAAVLDVFGVTTETFDNFGKAFRREQAFDPSIGVRQVTRAQCPAIRFLSKMRGNRGRAPRLNLESVEIKSGELLSGSIDNVTNRTVELLLVSDSGVVQNLSNLLKQGLDSLSFSMGIKRNEPGAAPELLIVVSTQQPLDMMRQRLPMSAEEFFTQPFSQSDINGMTLAVRHFRLTGE